MTFRTRRARLRPEIQLLRAVAVLAVVTNHFWPGGVTGGYIGVDVFFVVSGFLITSHLLRELSATGRIRLANFWARRVRRLLPAAFLVLFACFVLTMTVIPASARTDGLRQIVASALYVQNWALVADSVDYFQAGAAATTVQHFWSLSVEEQFYILWPLLLLGCWWWARGSRARIMAVVCVVGALSLSWCVWQSFGPTASVAYFSTATRAWEFCAGALLALLPGLQDGTLPERFTKLRIAAGLVGLGLIGGAALFFDDRTVFPGFAALTPVTGAVLVLLGGSPRTIWSVGGLSRIRPLRYVGDISYSLYLWHWPLILVAPVIMLQFGGVNNLVKAVILVVSLVLAAATKHLVEDRFRAARPNAGPGRSFIIPVAGAATAIALTVGATVLVLSPAAEASRQAMDELRASGCWGAQAVANGCEDPFGAAPTIDGAAAYADRIRVCDPVVSTAPPRGSSASCDYGDGRSVIAVVGDSHSQIIATAVAAWAVPKGFTVRLFAEGSCPVLGVRELNFPNQVPADSARTPATWQRCQHRSSQIMEEIRNDDRIGVVIATNATGAYIDRGDPAKSAVTTASASAGADSLIRDGKEVVIVRDVPGVAHGNSAPECLSLHPRDPVACSVLRSEIFPRVDPFVAAAAEKGLPVVDLSDYLCDDERCYAAVGGVVAYWDRAHLTASMTESLTPMVGDQLEMSIRARSSAAG